MKLAIRILNFVPNSASTERIFSSMGDIKTKKRSRLTPQKTRDTAFFKLEIRREQAINGTARTRAKRQFGTKEKPTDFDNSGSRLDDEEVTDDEGSGSETDCPTDDDEGNGKDARSFSALAKRIKRFVKEDDDEPDVGEEGENAATDFVPARQVILSP